MSPQRSVPRLSHPAGSRDFHKVIGPPCRGPTHAAPSGTWPPLQNFTTKYTVKYTVLGKIYCIVLYLLLLKKSLFPSLRITAVSWLRLKIFQLIYKNNHTRNNYMWAVPLFVRGMEPATRSTAVNQSSTAPFLNLSS